MKQAKVQAGKLRTQEKILLFFSFIFLLLGTGIAGFVGYQQKLLQKSQKTAAASETPSSSAAKKKNIPFQKGKGPREYVDGNGSVMVLVSAGKWKGPDGQERQSREFLIDRTEVTYQQFQQFLKKHPEWQKGGEKAKLYADANYLKDWDGVNFPKEKANLPVVWVSWYAAKAYAEWLGKRLPTEEEWMRAASGTQGNLYPWGNDEPSKQVANFGLLYGKPLEVDTLPQGASPEGCLHMAGNVWEWCADEFTLPNLSLSWRLLKGGSFRNLADNLKVTYRTGDDPKSCREHIGFRCVWSPKE